MFNLEKITRENIKKAKPYSSARDEYKGEARIFLDANENALGSVIEGNFNRYPDPYQENVKLKLAKIKKVSIENIFLGNGSDEAIDLLFRAFCEPNIDNVILLPPTYGMYQVAAQINDIQVIEVPLLSNFEIDLDNVFNVINSFTKLIFICSPNNPSGNQIEEDIILKILENFNGIVVVDEAYIDFAEKPSVLSLMSKYANLVVLQTFSKAWGMAALRVGMAFADADIIQIINKIKPPYNINSISQDKISLALDKFSNFEKYVSETKKQRLFLASELEKIEFIDKIYPSDANFILVSVKNASKIYDFLANNGIIVRNRSKMPNCDSCLRITVGTELENAELIKILNQYVG